MPTFQQSKPVLEPRPTSKMREVRISHNGSCYRVTWKSSHTFNFETGRKRGIESNLIYHRTLPMCRRIKWEACEWVKTYVLLLLCITPTFVSSQNETQFFEICQSVSLLCHWHLKSPFMLNCWLVVSPCC